jgi:hypothetical protein
MEWPVSPPPSPDTCDSDAQAPCGDLGIAIDREGRWLHDGRPIPRHEMVCLFASMLRRAADGGYLLVAPGECGRIQVEDVPFLAVELVRGRCHGQAILSLRTSLDEIVTIDAAHPLRIGGSDEEPMPYVLVRPGLEARLTRSVYYDLVSTGREEIQDGRKVFGVWSSGTFFPLGRLDHDD